MVSVQLLGGAFLRSGDKVLNGPAAQRHRVALLALLVASWPRPLARDRAMALLWPERDLPRARGLLNLAVHVLRAALGADAIVTTGDALLFDPAHLQCDLHELRLAMAAKDDEAVARLWIAPLLDGLYLGESVEFGYWLDDQRAELARAQVDALRRIADRQQRAGDVEGRVATCRRLVAADPHSSAYARELMLALDAAGDRAGALQHAREHARRRRVDFELGPDAEVLALEERLRASAQPMTSSRERSGTVFLPALLNLTMDVDDAPFTGGITQEVLARLAHILSVQGENALRIAAALQRRVELAG
jgi:DNA-binding SARP family transcriptional activator